MGTEVRLIGSGLDAARAWLERYEARLSRFRPDSELSRLNADPRAEVPASPMLRAAIQAALWAAQRTGGLVDPTVTPRDAAAFDLADAPPRRPGRPSGRWRTVRVTRDAIHRPPGVTLDTGGTGKGLAADHLAARIDGTADCGGDVRVTGARDVQVLHPFTGDPCATLRIRDGAVATSGLDRRGWHVVDPATDTPAWTGTVAATALAPTALEAEALAKAALLGRPEVLRRHGGLTVDDHGKVRFFR
jgi:FAD:protein FMN transferase